MTTLSIKQKSHLAQLAAEAYRALHVIEPDADNWRRAQVKLATGQDGLRQCTQDHYNQLVAHFQDLLGQPDRALNTLLKDQQNPHRQALHILNRETENAKAYGISYGYVEGMAVNRFGVTPGQCTTKQLWQLIFTIRNRVNSRKAKMEAAESIPF